MPHHSHQQRQMNAAFHQGPMMGGTGSPGAAGLQPFGGSMDFRPRIMNGMHMQVPHPGMRVPPRAMHTGWMQSHVDSPNSSYIHHVPHTASQGASFSDSPRLPVGEEGTTSPGSLYKAGSKSFDSPREIAASVLLLAAGGSSKESKVSKVSDHEERSKSDAEESAADSSRPLKKRKKLTDIVRKQPEQPEEPCHVSPISHASGNLRAVDASNGSEGTSGDASTGAAGSAATSRTSSYDLKDGQALHDSSKIADAKDIAPPTHVVIPHFPSVLHQVLTDSAFAGKVIQWLPHGQTWKIVRWDALRRQVLPKYFPQLREEDSKNASGSIDAFLWHLTAWGFDEITDGPDAGAYAHVLFRRDLPDLCMQMKFVGAPDKDEDDNEDDEVNEEDTTVVSPGTRASHSDKTPSSTPTKKVCDTRRILQVPSLASNAGVSAAIAKPSNAEDDSARPRARDGAPYFPGHPFHPHWGPMAGGPVFVNYRPDEASMSDIWPFYPKQWVGSLPPQDSARSQSQGPPYSPIRIRSGRGAGRLGANRNPTSSQESSPTQGSGAPAVPAPARSSFPVSNRGRGRRLQHVRRHPADGATQQDDATVSNPEAAEKPETIVGDDAGKEDCSVETSKAKEKPKDAAHRAVLKRKLPLARKP